MSQCYCGVTFCHMFRLSSVMWYIYEEDSAEYEEMEVRTLILFCLLLSVFKPVAVQGSNAVSPRHPVFGRLVTWWCPSCMLQSLCCAIIRILKNKDFIQKKTHTHTQTHTQMHARVRAHTHTHTHTRMHRQKGETNQTESKEEKLMEEKSQHLTNKLLSFSLICIGTNTFSFVNQLWCLEYICCLVKWYAALSGYCTHCSIKPWHL